MAGLPSATASSNLASGADFEKSYVKLYTCRPLAATSTLHEGRRAGSSTGTWRHARAQTVIFSADICGSLLLDTGLDVLQHFKNLRLLEKPVLSGCFFGTGRMLTGICKGDGVTTISFEGEKIRGGEEGNNENSRFTDNSSVS